MSPKREPRSTPPRPLQAREPGDLDGDQIRKFVATQPDYNKVAQEVAYILRKRLSESEIEVAAVSNRAKSLDSFIEKAKRKQYYRPFSEIQDRAGVRVVYHYKTDSHAIADIIAQEFNVFAEEPSAPEVPDSQFGYTAVHYVVTLGAKSSGARYDDLKSLLCEIQVRTIAQDAWAIISHHLVYKSEAAVPKHLRRKLNSLAGLFETADDQFDQIRRERDAYLSKIAAQSDEASAFLAQPVDLDTLEVYARWKFPDVPAADHSFLVMSIIARIDQEKYRKLKDVDEAVERGLPAAMATIENDPRVFSPHSGNYISLALGFADPDHRQRARWSDYAISSFEQYKHLAG